MVQLRCIRETRSKTRYGAPPPATELCSVVSSVLIDACVRLRARRIRVSPMPQPAAPAGIEQTVGGVEE
jgi:hypothetical protein